MHTKQLLVRLEPAEHKGLKVAAAHLETSMAELVRQAVRAWLKNHARRDGRK